MYGYVVPDKKNLLMKEYSLYQAHYCGICRAMGKLFGQVPRITINYDITFFSLFVHDILNKDVDFTQKRCAMHAFQKRGSILKSELTGKVAALNILMAYNNAKDNITDGGLKKAMPKLILKRAYKKAKKILPGADENIYAHYSRLKALEKENCESPDRAADCFALMMRDAGRLILEQNATPATDEFFYNLGRWVYFADALDDIDEDFKKKQYNPLLAAYKNYENRTQFIATNKAGICALLYGTMNRMAELVNGFNLTQSQNLIRNIAIYGIRNKTQELLESKAKLKREKV